MREFGRRELELMQVLWGHGKQTAREIRERLHDDPADATVRTMLRILEGKGCVAHTKKGRAFIYHATVPQRSTVRSYLKRLVESFFDGSPEALVAHLVDEKDLTPEALEEIVRGAKTREPARKG